MSIHKSLKLKGSLKRQRNVLKRSERIDVLRERGAWDKTRSVYGLPKTRTLGA